jgi:hypothetical protein
LTARLGVPPEKIFTWPRWERLCDAELGTEEADELIAAIETIQAATVATPASSAPGGGDSV